MNPIAISPRLTLLLLILWGVSLLGIYRFAARNESNACVAAQVTPLTQGIERHDARAAAGVGAEKRAVRRTARTEAVFSGIQRGLLDYAKKMPPSFAANTGGCSLDADGLRLWRAANLGAEADGTGASQGDSRQPAAAAAEERRRGGSAGESYRRGTGVSPVPGYAPGADGLAGGDR